jgi:hypothetical protein
LLDDLNMIALGAIGLCMMGLFVCAIKLLVNRYACVNKLIVKTTCMIYNSVHQVFNNTAIPVLVPAFRQLKYASNTSFSALLPQLGIVLAFLLYPIVVLKHIQRNQENSDEVFIKKHSVVYKNLRTTRTKF